MTLAYQAEKEINSRIWGNVDLLQGLKNQGHYFLEIMPLKVLGNQYDENTTATATSKQSMLQPSGTQLAIRDTTPCS